MNKTLTAKEYAIPVEYDENTDNYVIKKDLTIRAPKGSKAQAFAKKNKIKFKAL